MTMTTTNTTTTKGFGFYLRRLPPHTVKNGQVLITRLKAAKATWVSLMVEAEDGYVSPRSNIKDYGDDLVLAGFDVWVWTFPGSQRAASVQQSEAAAILAVDYCKMVRGKGVMLDIEKAYRGKKESLNALVDKTISLAKNNNSQQQSLSVGFVSYPLPTLAKDIDWTCLKKCDFGSPMLYDTSKTKELVDRSMKEYTKYNKVWIPSLATYDTQAPGTEEVQLKGDLDRVFEGNGDKGIKAAIFWSESTTSDKERKVIADYSDLLFI